MSSDQTAVLSVARILLEHDRSSILVLKVASLLCKASRQSWGDAVQFASDRLRKDRNFILEAQPHRK
eukprot:5069661-Amphidinium_carterae.1